jgi:hypothetical protein
MRGDRARRIWAAGLAAAVVAAGGAACTADSGDGPDKATAKACRGGTYAWSEARRWTELTALADSIRIEKKQDSYSARLKPVGDTVHRPTVSGAPKGVGAAGVINALGRHLKVEQPLAGPSETERPEEDHYFEAETGDLRGAYYSWGSIGMVEADFTYTCGSDRPLAGHVRTWGTVGTGFLSCSVLAEDAAGRTAARETCPAGSAAAKQA